MDTPNAKLNGVMYRVVQEIYTLKRIEKGIRMAQEIANLDLPCEFAIALPLSKKAGLTKWNDEMREEWSHSRVMIAKLCATESAVTHVWCMCCVCTQISE